jgi:hypothetical protein
MAKEKTASKNVTFGEARLQFIAEQKKKTANEKKPKNKE